MKYNKQFTISDLDKLLKEIADIPRPKEFKVLAGCKTNGFTDLELGSICDDPECPSCGRFIKIFKEEVKKYNETKNS